MLFCLLIFVSKKEFSSRLNGFAFSFELLLFHLFSRHFNSKAFCTIYEIGIHRQGKILQSWAAYTLRIPKKSQLLGQDLVERLSTEPWNFSLDESVLCT